MEGHRRLRLTLPRPSIDLVGSTNLLSRLPGSYRPRHLLPVASEPKSALFGGVAGPLALLEQRPIGTAAPPGQGLAQPELKRQYD